MLSSDWLIFSIQTSDWFQAVIADMGCGEGRLARSVPNTVHSFDLVAANDSVTACDIAHVPLEDNCVDTVVS